MGQAQDRNMSHPARDAWIEIIDCGTIEIGNLKSHPARDAWIEIGDAARLDDHEAGVASREGCVD